MNIFLSVLFLLLIWLGWMNEKNPTPHQTVYRVLIVMAGVLVYVPVVFF